jgi:polyhydroxyalkanoate synthesis repressor PhaR
LALIKRYANRKLYDTANRCYVTLADIAEMVQAGERIEVRDHENGTDLTTVTLVQVLFEQEKRIGGILTRDFLSGLLQEGQNALEGIRGGLQALLDPNKYVSDELERRLEHLVRLGYLNSDEHDKLTQLLLDPNIHISLEGSQGEVTDSQMESLLEQIEQLEQAIAHYQNSIGSNR